MDIGLDVIRNALSSSPAINTEYISYLSRLLNSLLDSALGRLGGGLDGVNSFMLNHLGGFDARVRLVALPHEDTGHLDGTHASEEEVHSGEPRVMPC